MTLETPAKPRAYSYLRFSTPEQAKGDSFRRQTALAEAYALKKGLHLDDTLNLRDVGVSAFRGSNSINGHLGKFREHVASGEVPQGSYLLVESLDRLSREEVGSAQLSFLNLLESGVRVVTLLDETEYTWEGVNSGGGMTALIISLSILFRANEESATKSRRLKEAWANKRSTVSQRPMTAQTPGWIRLDPATRTLELIPDRAALLQQIFQWVAEGRSQHSIVKRLNTEGVAPWGRGKFWHRSYLVKLLTNPSAIGTFTPHTLEFINRKRTRQPLEPVPDYFPPAVSVELWHEVQVILSGGQRAKSRGRHASAPVTNMLAGIACCPLCGGTMTRTNKGRKSRPKYVCVKAKAGGSCTYRTVDVGSVEHAIITYLPSRLEAYPAGERQPELDGEVEAKHWELSLVADFINKLLGQIEQHGGSAALAAQLRDREAEFHKAKGELEALELRRATATGETVKKRIGELLKALADLNLKPDEVEGDPLTAEALPQLQPQAKGKHKMKAGTGSDATAPDVVKPQPPSNERVNLLLSRVFSKATIDYRSGLLELEWIHGGVSEVAFALPEDALIPV